MQALCLQGQQGSAAAAKPVVQKNFLQGSGLFNNKTICLAIYMHDYHE
jgi:hypothetical protein